jgi:SNF2-related domain
MRLVITGITDELLASLRTGAGSEIKDKTWGLWVEAVRKATVENELKFRLLKRQEVWSASYESTHARMELLLDDQVPEWRLFGKADPEEPANAPIRKLLVQPIARMRIPLDATSLLAGKWELSLPVTTTFEIEIEGIGELLPSWEAKLGLLSDFQDKKSWSHLRVQAPADINLDQDISGVYKWLENCGTATGALHKREHVEDGKKPMYFFFDPTRCGEPEDDFFVFSTSTKRYVWGEERPLTATVTPRWRPSGKEGAQKVECYMPGEWTPVDTLELRSVGAGENTTVAIPEHIHADVSEDSCSAANALLVCTVPLTSADEIWPQDTLWHEVDRIHERVTYQGLAWLTERVRQIESLANWMTIELPAEYVSCERCAPAQPAIKWRRRSDKKWHPIEDPVQAGSFEQRMKNRPAPFVTQLQLVDGIASVRIGLNVASLLHRALSRLPTEYRTFSPQLSWRLAADYDPAAVKFKPGDPAFTLRSNKLDAENTQPPNFKKYPLRPEQLRSLSWMLEREQSDECFMEEEVSEAMLGPLGWRAEGRAVRPVLVRGGVLADEVGYGKTAITLGLIDCSQPSPYPTPAESGVIPSKATLIVVPSHLGNQWPSEIEKFLGKGKYKVVRILNLTQLNGYTIADIADADIVIVSSSLFRSGDYLTNLSTLAGTKELPASDGRYFNACLRNAIQGLHEQVDRLRDEGTAAVVEVIEAGLAKDHDNIIEQSKRFVGSKYAELKEKEDTMQVDSDSPDDEPKKAKNRTWRDAWKLKTPIVRNNWRKMQAPLIEMFHFNRLVVDEYTYLEGKIHAVITSINADHRWVLSGTPPIHDFAAVKTIAVFLGIHLGVDDTEEGKTDFVKKRNREQTGVPPFQLRKLIIDVEKFHSFREVHTPSWHRRRHQVAQSFLDQFMRKV